MKLPALSRGAPVVKPSGTAPKPPDFALGISPRSPLAIPPRASARGILAKASENCLGPEVFARFLLKSAIRNLLRISPPSETYLFCSTFSKQGRHKVFPSNRRVRDSIAISPHASHFKLAKMRAGLGAGRPGSVTANISSRSAFIYLSCNVFLSF